MPFPTFTIIRLCGIAGILGALIMGSGDLLYHHIPGSKLSLAERMSSLPQARLVSAGALGLVGCWLYVLGAIHLYYAFLPVGSEIALTIAITFAMVMIAYGVAHAAYYAIGSSANVAREHGLDVESAGKAGEALYGGLYSLHTFPWELRAGSCSMAFSQENLCIRSGWWHSSPLSFTCSEHSF